MMKIVASPLVVVCCALLLTACASGGGSAPPSPAAAASGVPADTTRVYDVEQVTVKPRLANTTSVARALEQNYGGVQRDAGLEGTVQLRMVVERDGRTSSIVVVRSSDALFNDAALNVARAMRFNPAQVNGVPVRVSMELPITFRPNP
ncbi:MAG TPA: energy transducer TonB [Longimicrobium sp.]